MPIIKITLALLEDVLLFLSKVNEVNYKTPIVPLFNSTLGKHTRHAIEIFQCLLCQPRNSVVNYDTRKRDLAMETNKKVAIEAIEDIQQRLQTLENDAPIFVETDLLPNQKIHSSLLRELLYNYDHLVHHLALIRVGLHFVQPNIELPDRFGLAVSTINHHQQTN